MAKKIEINQKTASGYEVLYPVTEAGIVTIGENGNKVDTTLDSVYSTVDSTTVTIGTISAKADGMVILMKNVTVQPAAWMSDSTYTDYPWKAVIGMADIHKKYVSDVYFNMADATSGNFAPVSITGNQMVMIFAKEKPTSAILIPSIKCVVNVDDIEKDPILLTSIEVASLPTKLEYTEGDALDLTGLSIQANYDDGTSDIVDGWVSNPLPGTILNTVGTQTVTISYTQVG